VLKNEPYKKPNGETGQYTHKLYHLESRVPGFVRFIAPKGSLTMNELAWNAYPKCKTVVTNTYLQKKFEISIESIHLADAGTSSNPHNLTGDELKKREVVEINIAKYNNSVPTSDPEYVAEFDPTKTRSDKANRGPLKKTWIDEYRVQSKLNNDSTDEKSMMMPVMCAYKLVRCNFNYWGLQGRVETLIHTQEKRIFTNFHRQVYCWMDKWYGMTMQDIRRLEDKTKEDLDKMIKEGSVRGTQLKE